MKNQTLNSTSFSNTFFQTALLDWYRQNKREMPWRDCGNPYFVWISEVMLQQTQVATVIPYFERFVKRFPDVNALAEADQQDVLKLWEGLGYYSRARNLQAAAQRIVNEFDSNIPNNYDDFISLQGVGPYIAAAVQSIAFNGNYAVVDGNVKRVLSRLFLIEAAANDANKLSVFQKVADEILSKKHPGDYNQAVMELGATICKVKNPLCKECPVNSFCKAFQTNQQSEFPKRKVKPKSPLHRWCIVLVHCKNKYLLQKRPENGLLGGLWEFPTSEWHLEYSETENVNELTLKVACQLPKQIEKLGIVQHAFTHFKISCDVFSVEIQTENVVDTKREFEWLTFSELLNYPLPKTHHKIFDLLKNAQTNLRF